MQTKIIVPAFCGVLLFGCGSGSGNRSQSELEGTWISTCRAKSSSSSSYYEKNTLVFSGANLTSSIKSYSDMTCTTELSQMPSLVGDSTFSFGDFVVGTGAKEFNSQIYSLTITLKTDAYVSTYNGTTTGTTAICGGGFVKNTPKQLNAANCTNDATLGSDFNERFDIYKVFGDKLYFGVMGALGSKTDGSIGSRRPTDLDPAYYTKS